MNGQAVGNEEVSAQPETKISGVQQAWRITLLILGLVFVGLGLYTVVLSHATVKPIPKPVQVAPKPVAPEGLINQLKKRNAPSSGQPQSSAGASVSAPWSVLALDKPSDEIAMCVTLAKRLLEAPAGEIGGAPKMPEGAASAASSAASAAPALTDEEKSFMSEAKAMIVVAMTSQIDKGPMQHKDFWVKDFSLFACAFYKHPDVVNMRRAQQVPTSLFFDVIDYHGTVWRRNELEARKEHQRNLAYHAQVERNEADRVEQARQKGKLMQAWLMYLLATALVVSVYFALMEAMRRPHSKGQA